MKKFQIIILAYLGCNDEMDFCFSNNFFFLPTKRENGISKRKISGSVRNSPIPWCNAGNDLPVDICIVVRNGCNGVRITGRRYSVGSTFGLVDDAVVIDQIQVVLCCAGAPERRGSSVET